MEQNINENVANQVKEKIYNLIMENKKLKEEIDRLSSQLQEIKVVLNA